MSKSGTLPIITICIIVTIICMVVIARGSFAANDKFSIPAMQNYNEILFGDELNESERAILIMLIKGDKLLLYGQKKETLKSNLSGNIIKILDSKGHIIYENVTWVKPPRFYLNNFMIILAIITAFFSVGVIIARRNQLFVKEVEFDECNEEGF